jgi:hypothetical protein
MGLAIIAAALAALLACVAVFGLLLQWTMDLLAMTSGPSNAWPYSD